jgi:hypothetical protein
MGRNYLCFWHGSCDWTNIKAILTDVCSVLSFHFVACHNHESFRDAMTSVSLQDDMSLKMPSTCRILPL